MDLLSRFDIICNRCGHVLEDRRHELKDCHNLYCSNCGCEGSVHSFTVGTTPRNKREFDVICKNCGARYSEGNVDVDEICGCGGSETMIVECKKCPNAGWGLTTGVEGTLSDW